MKKQLKEQWTAALRSGKYEQGMALLRTDDNKYCCLGVLADITASWEDEDKTLAGGSAWVPSEDWCESMGLSYSYAETLANINDSGVSFADLADEIDYRFGKDV